MFNTSCRLVRFMQRNVPIHALFDIDGEHPVLKFNNTRYNFKTSWLKGAGNDVITSVLLGVYIDYLHKNLKNN
jgi:hypothetical protein